jgi:lysophospholipase L1-like esterase
MKQHKRLLMTIALVLASGLGQAAEADDWVGSWSAAMIRSPVSASALLDAPQAAMPLADQTLRQMVPLSAGGRRLRIRLANTFGSRALTLQAVSVGVQAPAGRGNLIPSSLHALRFDGAASVTIPAGASRYSDPLPVAVRAGDTLGVSIYVARATTPTTWHADAVGDSFVSARGDYTAAATMPVAGTIVSIDWLSGVEVEPDLPTSAIVMLGDSITNGFRSTVNADRRYPDLLARRLREADNDACRHAVLNAGIDGNQVSAFYGSFGLGQSMRKRFRRDVLAQRGVRSVLLLGGINDIGEPTMVAARQRRRVDGAALAGHVIDGLRDIIAQAHGAGLRIYGATLLPFAGTLGAYSAAGERARARVNDWIRHHAGYDAVIDFDAALRDPAHPLQLRPELDSGDHIHPNDAGYRAMAAAIPLRLFACAPQAPAATHPEP